MAGLLIPDRNRLPSVNLGKLSAILVTARAITAAEEVTIGLAGGHLPVIMGSSGRGRSPSKGHLGNPGLTFLMCFWLMWRYLEVVFILT